VDRPAASARLFTREPDRRDAALLATDILVRASEKKTNIKALLRTQTAALHEIHGCAAGPGFSLYTERCRQDATAKGR
jgi:hypothetical protein